MNSLKQQIASELESINKLIEAKHTLSSEELIVLLLSEIIPEEEASNDTAG